MTFVEFEQLPNPKGGRLELHHGEVVALVPPKHGHYRRQLQVRRLMERLADPVGEVGLGCAWGTARASFGRWTTRIARSESRRLMAAQSLIAPASRSRCAFAPGSTLSVEEIFS